MVVEFKNFQFTYHLKCIPLNEVKASVLAAINGNRQRFQACFKEVPVQQYSFVRLSDKELRAFQHFCDSNLDSLTLEPIEQYPSKEALVISYQGRMWKFPARNIDRIRLTSIVTLKAKFLIDLMRWGPLPESDYFVGNGWFYYPKIKHSPMIATEAAACVGHFLTELCNALSNLHEKGYAHLDVRLENICFHADETLVLVDLDRCTWSSDITNSDTTQTSCMYLPLDDEIDGTMIDWRQVGCLLLWIYSWEEQIKKKRSYHNQDLKLDHYIVREKFFCELMKGTTWLLFSLLSTSFLLSVAGKFNLELLHEFCGKVTKDTIGSVLRKRL